MTNTAASETSSMRAVAVVAITEHGEGSRQMLFVQNQQPIETYRPGSAHEPLRDPVGLRCANNLDPVAPKHLVKPAAKFLVPIAKQEANRFRPIRQGPRQLPGL